MASNWDRMKSNAHSEGYQEALDDLAAALERGGNTLVYQWIADNAKSRETARLFTNLLP